MSELSQNFSFINQETRNIASQFLEDLGGPVALGIWLCLKYRDDVSACSHSISPNLYIDGDQFRSDYVAAHLLSKFRDSSSSQKQAREIAARKKFNACEDQIRGVASYLKTIESSEFFDACCLRRARDIISEILGSVVRAYHIDDCAFGPGSSSSVPRRTAHPSRKFIATDVSSSCIPFVNMFFTDAKATRPMLNPVEYSVAQFVPKNFKSDRLIAVEPDWNIFFQKGIGKAIRRALKAVGIDLDNGAEVHQHLAQYAAKTGLLATMDLSSASDTISTALVRYLLPRDWWVVLNSMRTDQFLFKGEKDPVPLFKFAAMGNGFTFELETLVFYALTKAICDVGGTRGTVKVFGDDIICPVVIVPALIGVFTNCGFAINSEKSFAAGYFRESCGSHFFGAMDVKPIYIKENITHDEHRFKICNQIRRFTNRSYRSDVFETPFARTYHLGCRHIRRKFYIPEGFGDGGLVSNFDEVPRSRDGDKSDVVRRHKHGIEGFRVKCLLVNSIKGEDESYGMLIHKLRGAALKSRSTWFHSCLPIFRCRISDLRIAERRPETGNIFMTAGKAGYHVGWMDVLRWTDIAG